MTHPDELQDNFAPPSPRRTAFRLATAVVLLVACIAGARPTWRFLKGLRASQFVAQARSLLSAGDPSQAAQRARAAFQLAPNRPDVLRLNAELATHYNGRGALSLWGRLAESGHATPDDLAAYAEAGLRFGRLDLVRDIASNVVAQGPTSSRGERIASLYFAENGKLFEALHHARNAQSTDPENPTNAVLLADLLLIDPNPAPDVVAEARTLYWNAIRTAPQFRTHALRKLTSTPLGSRNDRERVAATLAAVTNRAAAEDILLVEAEVSLDPSSSSQVLSNVLATLPRDDLPRISAVADTLRRLGRHQEVLRLTSGGRERRSRELFLARIDALVATAQIEEAYRLALATDLPIPPYELELLRVRTAVRTGDPRRRDSHLRELIRSAGTQAVRLRTACELAEELGCPVIASEGWKTLAQEPAHAPEAYRRLQQIADREGDTWMARDHAQHAITAGVTDRDLRLDIALYDLLIGDESERALAEARTQVKDHPDDFRARSILALAHLRAGSPTNARTVLDRQVVNASTLTPSTLAILAAVYGGNGNERKARELAGSISLAKLRPQERDMVRPWLLPPPLNGTLPPPPASR